MKEPTVYKLRLKGFSLKQIRKVRMFILKKFSIVPNLEFPFSNEVITKGPYIPIKSKAIFKQILKFVEGM